MVQTIISNNSDKYSVAELAQMAVEGGCKWIRLNLPDCDDSFVRELCDDIVPMCKEAGVMLTIDDRPELARTLGLHGVHLHDKKYNPMNVREDLGPEAVIGVTVGDPSVALAMKKADIDYVELPADWDEDKIAAFMVDFRELDADYPVVAAGDITPLTAAATLALGVSGIAVGEAFCQASNPVEIMDNLLQSLK